MHDDDLPRVQCNVCQAQVRVRYYGGKGVRFTCPMCLNELRVESPSNKPLAPTARTQYGPTGSPSAPARVVLPCTPAEAVDAVAYAVRAADGEVTDMDRPNRRLRFNTPNGSAHRAEAYALPDGNSEVDIRPTAGGSVSAAEYRRLGESLLAYFAKRDSADDDLPARARVATARRPLPPRPSELVDADTLAIAAAVIGVLAVLSVPMPALAIMLGTGAAGLSWVVLGKARRNRREALAGFVIGVAAVLLSILWLMVKTVADAVRREDDRRASDPDDVPNNGGRGRSARGFGGGRR